MAGMSALVLRVVFSCSFPFFPSFLLFCICLFLSRFFHSRYFRSKQRTQSCSHSLTGSVYIWGQASKPCWSQALHPSLALFRPSASSQSFVPWVFPMLLRAAVPPSLPHGWHIWLGFAWLFSVPPVQSSCWTLGHSLISPLTYFICSNHTIFGERDSLLLCLCCSTTQLLRGSRHHMLP